MVWQLAEDGDGTRIEVQVDLPEADAYRLPTQRTVIADSLGNLSTLALAACS